MRRRSGISSFEPSITPSLVQGVALCLALAGCSDWKKNVVAHVAVDEPTQTIVTSEPPIALTRGGVTAELRPRARYATKAWAVAVDTGMDDGFEPIMSIDVALAWGPVADPDVLREMSFHLKRRYVSVRWDRALPVAQQVVMEHLANHHLIPSTSEVDAELKKVRAGDLVELEGRLVDVVAKGETKRTSLSRKDIGNGACEILYVERAHITRP